MTFSLSLLTLWNLIILQSFYCRVESEIHFEYNTGTNIENVLDNNLSVYKATEGKNFLL